MREVIRGRRIRAEECERIILCFKPTLETSETFRFHGATCSCIVELKRRWNTFADFFPSHTGIFLWNPLLFLYFHRKTITVHVRVYRGLASDMDEERSSEDLFCAFMRLKRWVRAAYLQMRQQKPTSNCKWINRATLLRICILIEHFLGLYY